MLYFALRAQHTEDKPGVLKVYRAQPGTISYLGRSDVKMSPVRPPQGAAMLRAEMMDKSLGKSRELLQAFLLTERWLCPQLAVLMRRKSYRAQPGWLMALPGVRGPQRQVRYQSCFDYFFLTHANDKRLFLC